MKSVVVLFILMGCGLQLRAQVEAQVKVYERDKFNPGLKKELDRIYEKDQQYRKYFIGTPYTVRDSLARAFGVQPAALQSHLEQLQAPIDSENIAAIQTIIKRYDYPGKTLVGEPTNMVAVTVICHSTLGQKYYPRVNQAHVMGELPQMAVAMLEDHVIVRMRQPQNYGSHAIAVPVKDTATGKVLTRYYISPVKNAKFINTMRRSRGFGNYIEEYARDIGAVYDPGLTWEKVANMRADAEGK